MARTYFVGEKRKGQMGGLTYYERKGQTVVRQTARTTGRPVRTLKSMEQRTKMANVLAAWRSFVRQGLKDNFELKTGGQTDYNAFVSINLRNARVCLSKQEAESPWNVCVADNFAVSVGTLQPAVEIAVRDGFMITDLALGDLQLGGDVKLDLLTLALLQRNRTRFESNDELVLYSMTQKIDFDGSSQGVKVDAFHLPLGHADTESTLRSEGLEGLLYNHGGFLAMPYREGRLMAWVQRRTDRRTGRIAVTSQNLVGFNPLLSQYTSEDALAEALASYGPLSYTALEGPVPTFKEQEPEAYARMKERYAEKRKQEEPQTTEPESLEEQLVEISTGVRPEGSGVALGAGTYLKGDQVRLRAVPAKGWRFLCWDDADTQAERSLEAAEATRLVALFTKI